METLQFCTKPSVWCIAFYCIENIHISVIYNDDKIIHSRRQDMKCFPIINAMRLIFLITLFFICIYQYKVERRYRHTHARTSFTFLYRCIYIHIYIHIYTYFVIYSYISWRNINVIPAHTMNGLLYSCIFTMFRIPLSNIWLCRYSRQIGFLCIKLHLNRNTDFVSFGSENNYLNWRSSVKIKTAVRLQMFYRNWH